MLSGTKTRLGLISLEPRITPAIFNIANGDIAAFVSAVTTTSTNKEADTINLAFGGTYDFTAVAGTTISALPVFDFDANESNTVTVNGNNATLNRTGTEEFRFFFAQGTAAGRATLNVNQVTFNGGKVSGGRLGGAAAIRSAFGNFTDCTFTGNLANDGGAIIGAVDTTIGGLTLTRCTFSGNTADGASGGNSGRGGAIVVAGGATLTITDCSILNNLSRSDGSGIYVQDTSLTISNSTVTGNAVTDPATSGVIPVGGGIFVLGNLTATGCDISHNTTFASGGGVYVQGNATIQNCSFIGNNSTSPLSGGGAIFIQGTLALTNSTLDGNRAGGGGGIAMAGGSLAASILNSTITNNTAFLDAAQGGGIFFFNTVSAVVENSIVANNSFEATTTAGTGTNIFGPVQSVNYCLIGTDDGWSLTGTKTGALIGTPANPLDPRLDALTNNGGATFFRPPLPGSPIVDAGDPNYGGAAAFDQRGAGFPRVLFGRIDIGSIEVPQVDLRIEMDDGVTSVIPGATVTYTITVSNVGFESVANARVRDFTPFDLMDFAWTAVFSAGASGNAAGQGDIDELVDLAAGASVTYALTATVRPSATGSVTNIATILPPVGAADPNDDNTATDTDFLNAQADGFVTVNSSGVAAPNGTITYTIQVGNFGLSTAAGFRLTDVLPTQFVAATYSSTATTGAQGNTVFGTGNINDLLTLDPGSSVTYTLQAVVSADIQPGDLVNTVNFTAPAGFDDPVASNNTAFDTVVVRVGNTVIVVGAEAGQSPIVRIIDPSSGVLRKTFFAYDGGFRGGVRVATADFNGDSTLDIVTAAGAGGGPHVRIFNGLTGQLMGEYFAYGGGFSGGVYVATGDVNGDGVPDVITGAGAGGGPHVRVFSGASPQLITEFFAYAPNFTGGVRVAAGDVNKDGKADIITGAGAGGGPHVIAFDGVTRQPLRSFFAYAASFRGGVFVSSGDFNRDGFADIVTAAGEGGGPHVRIIDGRNGAQIREFFAFPVNGNPVWSSGARVAVSADINGDGIPELVVAPGRGRSSLVRHLDGASLGLIREFAPSDPSFLGGVFVGGG